MKKLGLLLVLTIIFNPLVGMQEPESPATALLIKGNNTVAKKIKNQKRHERKKRANQKKAEAAQKKMADESERAFKGATANPWYNQEINFAELAKCPFANQVLYLLQEGDEGEIERLFTSLSLQEIIQAGDTMELHK